MENVCISKFETFEGLTALFLKVGILEMLEGKDQKNCDFVATRYGQIVDVCFGNSKTVSVPHVFI